MKNIRKIIKYSEDKWQAVCNRAEFLNLRTGTYIRRIAVRGTIKFFDMKQFNHLIVSFNRIGNELNQIARVVNSTNSVFAKDIEDMKKSFNYLEDVFANYLLPIKSLNILKSE